MATDLLAGVVAVCLLALLAVGAVLFVKAAFFHRNVVVIAPFFVTGREDPDGRLGRSLAVMLHGRVRQLEQEFQTSQQNLAAPDRTAPETELDARALFVPRFDVQPITMATISSGDVTVDVKVAGVEVGGLAAWLERAAVRRRALIFAVHFGDDEALVSANLAAGRDLGAPDLWLRTEPEPGKVVTALSYALLQGRMIAAKVRAVDALELEEFQILLTSLSAIAGLNRRIASGRARSSADFSTVFTQLSPVLEKVPEWVELIHLMAQLAERTDEPGRALELYERLRRLDGPEPRLESAQRAAVDRKIETLTAGVQPVLDAREKEFVDAVRAYEQHLGLAPPHPELVFMREPPEMEGIQAVWNQEKQRYEVNPAVAADPATEMVKVSALMGRFMARHFDRCSPTIDWSFWNVFRMSVVEFLVETEPHTSYVSAFTFPLLDTLRRISDSSGVLPARGLALRLLDRFDCDWDANTLPDRMAAVGVELGLTEDVVRRAFAGAVA